MRLASRDVKGVAAYLASDACQKVVVLTGAGVSCAAGIPDFRSPGGMYDTLRPELITASPQERAAMARDPTCVVLKDMFLQNQFPYHEVRRPFILGTQRQQWKATLFHRFLAVWKSTSASGAPDNSSLSHFSAMTRPCRLRRAVTKRHRHAIEQASRRWRGGRRDDSARRRRKILISTQVVSHDTTTDARHIDYFHSVVCCNGHFSVP